MHDLQDDFCKKHMFILAYFLYNSYTVSINFIYRRKNMRILGIDYGDSRIGVAVSDAMGWTAQGLKNVSNKSKKTMLKELESIISEYKPEKIVIGLPKNMDGSVGFRGEATYAFEKQLKTIYSGEIVFQDERLSTVSATRVLNETNTRGKKRKDILDTVAACFILETYLNSTK